ncbi:transposon Tf2-9 polyprotein [Trichonephila clavipes]|nr:transposon Tf2-9 polyprotein [Trichonephila clavipes]
MAEITAVKIPPLISMTLNSGSHVRTNFARSTWKAITDTFTNLIILCPTCHRKPPQLNCQTAFFSQEVKHNIKHFIETSGPPVFAKARRLAPDRLKIAKSEFQHMLNLGHVRPSKSNYASPLHIVPKKDSNDWRPRKVKIKPEEALEWTDEATTAFELVKQALAHATLLHHPMPNAPLSIWVDASDFAVGGALAQFHDNVWQPLALIHEIICIPKELVYLRPRTPGHIHNGQKVSAHVGRKRVCDLH